MVYGDVVDYQAEIWSESGRLEVGIGSEKVSNHVDVAAQNKVGHGSARPGPVVRGD
jgi:hypothetical protein